jgi:hypothetical protein
LQKLQKFTTHSTHPHCPIPAKIADSGQDNTPPTTPSENSAKIAKLQVPAKPLGEPCPDRSFRKICNFCNFS